MATNVPQPFCSGGLAGPSRTVYAREHPRPPRRVIGPQIIHFCAAVSDGRRALTAVHIGRFATGHADTSGDAGNTAQRRRRRRWTKLGPPGPCQSRPMRPSGHASTGRSCRPVVEAADVDDPIAPQGQDLPARAMGGQTGARSACISSLTRAVWRGRRAASSHILSPWSPPPAAPDGRQRWTAAPGRQRPPPCRRAVEKRAWPLIMTWCPDKRAVNTPRSDPGRLRPPWRSGSPRLACTPGFV
jgi:hypothetical protein